MLIISILFFHDTEADQQRVIVESDYGELVVHPGQEADYVFTVENNGTVSDRYLIEISREYQWDTSVVVIVLESNGELLPYTVTETGVLTTEGLPAGDRIFVQVRIFIPMLTGNDEWNSDHGLDSGDFSTISLWAYSMGDDFTSAGTDQFEARMTAYHGVGIETYPDSRSVSTIGEEGDRIALYQLSITYLSNDGLGDVIRLGVVSGVSPQWGVFLNYFVFNPHKPGQVFNTTLSVVAPVGMEWTSDPWEVQVRGWVNSGNGTTISTFTYLKKTGKVSIFVEGSTVTCDPGQRVPFQISVQNLGNTRDSFSMVISSQKQSHWIEMDSNETEQVNPYETTDFSIRILVPTLGAPPNGSLVNFSISAFSNLSGGVVNDTIRFSVLVGITRNASIQLTTTSSILVLPEETRKFGVTLINTGNLPEEIRVHLELNIKIDGVPYNDRITLWNVVISREREFLQIGESFSSEIAITASNKILLGERVNITIRAVPTKSSKDPSNFEAVNGTVIVGNYTEISIIPESQIQHGKPNETVEHPIIIRNDSDHNISINGSSSGNLFLNITNDKNTEMEYWLWTPSNFTILPYTESKIYIFLKIPRMALAHTYYNLSVNIKGYYNITKEIAVKVTQVFEVELKFMDTSHKIIQGTKTNYTLTVLNNGNGKDVVELKIFGTEEYWKISFQNSTISIEPYSEKSISVYVTSPSTNEYHGRSGEGVRYLINATSTYSYYEIFTPFTYLTFIGVEPPEDTLRSYYTFDPNLSNETYSIGTVHGYCYQEKSIIYTFTFMNLGEGPDTMFVVPEMFPPSYINITLRHESGEEITGSFTAPDYVPITLYLEIHVSTIVSPFAIDTSPLYFKINSPVGSASFSIKTEILYLDLYIQKIEVPTSLAEGNEVEVKIIVSTASGLSDSTSDIYWIDYVINIRIVGYFDGDRVFEHIIDSLKIGATTIVTITWKTPALNWNEKEKKDFLSVHIEDYETYQGDVETYKDNNQMRNKVTIRDAYLTDRSNMESITSLSLFITLMIMGFFIYSKIGKLLLRKKQRRKSFYVLTSVIMALLWGSIFNFPWQYAFGDGNTAGLFLSYLSIIVVFPCLIIFISNRTRSTRIVGISSIIMFPLYLIALSAGAGIDAILQTFVSTIDLEISGNVIAFPLWYLILIYFAFGILMNNWMKQRYNATKKFIEDIDSGLNSAIMELRGRRHV